MNKKWNADDLRGIQPAENVFDFDTGKPASKRQPKHKPKAEKPKRPRSGETFARIPYRQVTAAYGKLSAVAYAVLIELDHQHFIGFGKNPVKLTNQTDLAAAGMHRNSKAKGLRQLQKAGLVRYVQTGHEAFTVTLTWHPTQR